MLSVSPLTAENKKPVCSVTNLLTVVDACHFRVNLLAKTAPTFRVAGHISHIFVTLLRALKAQVGGHATITQCNIVMYVSASARVRATPHVTASMVCRQTGCTVSQSHIATQSLDIDPLQNYTCP